VFSVSTVSGKALITDVGNVGSPSVTGAGSASVTGQTCLNGSFANPTGACSTTLGSLLNPVLPKDKTPPAIIFDTPLTSLGLRDTVIVSGGGTGTGRLLSFSTTVSEVPEPSTFFLLGGVLGLLAFSACAWVSQLRPHGVHAANECGQGSEAGSQQE
jgi:hypothetical protein